MLDADYEVFARDGYHGTTLDAIAARAKLSKGALANRLALDVILEPGEEAVHETREAMATAMALLWRGTAASSTTRGEDE